MNMTTEDKEFAFDEMTSLPEAFVRLAESFEFRFTKQESRILARLLSRHGRICTREQIYAASRSYSDEVQTKIVDVYICKIRAKLLNLNPEWKIITVWGIGYRAEGFPADLLHQASSEVPYSVISLCDAVMGRSLLPMLARIAPSHREAVKEYLVSVITSEV